MNKHFGKLSESIRTFCYITMQQLHDFAQNKTDMAHSHSLHLSNFSKQIFTLQSIFWQDMQFVGMHIVGKAKINFSVEKKQKGYFMFTLERSAIYPSPLWRRAQENVSAPSVVIYGKR